ncbi:ParA family protein [Nisaea acidiphila]|uniref:ParA family protein n=1 Tax=Nisaea acidiphila TaxID=1862145 RepID=A0A9J7AXW7_9PROT|nr:ParA family protein [Nisaea acidiphila]UUX50269.1 ParA family protein [Nisaea acidiphila]
MFTIAVANTKGGAGKTTLATTLAAHYAARGLDTALGDLDLQQSSLGWLRRRPSDLPRIRGVDLEEEGAKPRKKTEILVVDCVAAMSRDVVKDVVKQADVIVIPVLPSAFDEDGTRRFIDQLGGLKPIRKNKRAVAFVGNRVRLRTRAAEQLEHFLEDLGFPKVATLRDTQLFAQAAAEGKAIQELTSRRAYDHVMDLQPLIDFIEETRLAG